MNNIELEEGWEVMSDVEESVNDLESAQGETNELLESIEEQLKQQNEREEAKEQKEQEEAEAEEKNAETEQAEEQEEQITLEELVQDVRYYAQLNTELTAGMLFVSGLIFGALIAKVIWERIR